MQRCARLSRLLIVLGVCAAPVSALAASWWNADWQYRKEIGLDLSPSGADIAGTAQDVPVLVRLSLANFAYFGDAKPDGSDFRVIAGNDKTPLKFHLERYDAQNQMAYLWVGVPSLTGGAKSDKFYIYYGNPSAAAAADPAGTFDVSQVLVLEFGQQSGPPVDLTAYKNNPAASTADAVAASLVAGGAKFSGGQNGGQTISIPASSSLRLLPNQGMTFSAWVKFDQPQAQADLISLAEQGRELTLGIEGTHAFARYMGAGAPVSVTQGSDLSAGSWHLLALTVSEGVGAGAGAGAGVGAGRLTLYVDGVAAGQAPVTLQEIGGTLTIGGSAHGSNYLNAEVDEVGVARIARSADWIRAIARSEGIEAPLVLYGADGQKESGGQGSYFLTIAKNLTVDGWVVIGICMTMLCIALIIMLLKAIYLSRVEGANGRFLRVYQQLPVTGDEQSPAALRGEAGQEEGPYGASTLYRLYQIGLAELDKRIANQSVGARRVAILSPQSTEAIRATMDATLVRLQQRMSSQMVLLTIAISGGPFLGLLGTVIGVMITFAAIALSGDVNINAIAPGTAAALAATVAGLAVAIPCLFGYNWLNTRIKSIQSNNRVFLDEFVARLAEQYS
jgi:biopolymer transport protein ExbB